jgi:Protein of unknown function (DUF1592)/Protein of unknown function (DUF1588)/Protein of unknown function (DUF1595)/Protein of unknown function (DUF1585)/Protein of unknown function (DUF1587)/Planctomycete cytochrome C
MLSRGRFIHFLLIGTLFALTPLRVFAEDQSSFQRNVRPLLESHCFKCHGPDKQRGNVDLSPIADEEAIQSKPRLWRKAAAQLESSTMPPAKQPQPTAEQRAMLVRWVRQTLDAAGSSAVRDAGPSVVRRLDRSEYNRTIHDLLGIEFDAASAVGMTDEPTGGFDNLAEALNLPPALMEKYFAAADKVLDRFAGRDDQGKPLPPNDPTAKKAEQARKTVFFVASGAGLSKHNAARQILTRFLHRAYRRPVADDEVERYLALFDRADGRGESFEDSMRLPLKAVLVSPNFLYRIETDRAPAGSAEAYRVDDHELAVRLAYFLWSTMPDDELSALADQGKLADPEVLHQQVARMLKNPKARALTDNFGAEWMQLRKLDDARPSTEFFPTFNQQLRQAMHEEASTFFDKLREGDRPILDLLDADYTYVNEDLAKHYGIPGVQGKEMRRVVLPPDAHRGGLLGMGAILALTSHTSRTSPTMRGKWVLEVVFGTPPAPPPPNVGAINDHQDKGKEPKTFRELLAQHAREPACAGCHAKIDPLGFALENFDAVGRWRETANDRPVDASGRLPSGEQFTGVQELKQVVLRHRDQFVRNLAEQMLTYALGRELKDCDDGAVSAITANLRKNDQRFSALVTGVVDSFAFQHRRNLDSAPRQDHP